MDIKFPKEENPFPRTMAVAVFAVIVAFLIGMFLGNALGALFGTDESVINTTTYTDYMSAAKSVFSDANQLDSYMDTAQDLRNMNGLRLYGSKDGDIAKGAELAMKTVNRNFQMNIERYVVVNIHGLADIIEALGGVDIELTKGEAQAINYELHVKEPMDDVERDKLEVADGVQHLDGMEAVTYGRIRNLQGQNDLNRNERQRKLLEALLKKVMEDMDLTKFLNLIETALPYGKTNLTADELLSLGMTVLSGSAMQNLASGGEVVGQFGIPMEKQYGYREFNGESLVYISDKRMQTTLTAMQEFIYGQSYVK